MEKEFSNVVSRQESFFSEADEKLRLVETKTAEVENAREALQDKLALNAAASYWGTKRIDHISRLKWLLASLAGWLLVNAATIGSALYLAHDELKHANDFYDLVPYLPTNIILLLVGVWGVRVLVRLMLSENHLSTRAEEKGILIKTYVALVNEGMAKEEDRSIILASVFSHTQDGLVQDDGMPQTGPMSMLTGSKN